MNLARIVLDRTAVLFLGIGVGAAMGSAFVQDGSPGIATAPASAADASEHVVAAAAKPPSRACSHALKTSPRLASALAAGGPVEVGVFGDSFGDGIWAGLYNDLRSDSAFTVHQFSHKSTGFTRYRQLNLQDDLDEKLAGQPIDLAVISFGANDAQDIWEEGHLMPYMSADWKRVVGARARAYVERIRRDGSAIVWIGLPRMRKPAFDHQIAEMNAFYADLMCDLNVAFIDTSPKSVDQNGDYTEYLRPAGGGEPIKARASDGIHMSMTGYRILISDMTGDIRRLAGQLHPAAPSQGAARAYAR